MPFNPTAKSSTDLMSPGDPVEVLGSFDGRWSSGFEIAEVLGGPPNWTYRLRRTSDGQVLPRNFDHRSVAPQRAATNEWMVPA